MADVHFLYGRVWFVAVKIFSKRKFSDVIYFEIQ